MGQAAHDPRPQGQVAHERAQNEVSDVLLNLEHTISRAKKAARRLGESPEEHNAKLALAEARVALEATRSRLQKDAYFAGDELRLV
ncbi:hypothetical protein WDZ17_10855 [Pseudokineococcus basanitobsidens]|uniref:Uncharacterized protein n=1 Tax=Pseudokineococcus basanitobsidens TaxID=1926649 RepID=A0ABU8RL17_9ACTN